MRSIRLASQKRQVALQQRRAVAVITLGFLRQRQLRILRRWKLPGVREPAGAAVDVVRRLHEQLQQRRVRARARHQRGRGGDERHIVRGQVARQVHHAARQHHRGEERQAARVGLGLRELEQLHPRRLQQHLHHQRFRHGGKHHRVEFACQQRHHCGRLLQAAFLEAVARDAIDLQQLGDEAGHAAAARAHVHAPAAQIGQLRQGRFAVQALGGVAAVEQPHRLEIKTAQRHQRHAALILVSDARGVARTAAHETQVHGLRGVAQQAPVLRRAQRGPEHDVDAVTLELGRVALAEFGVVALFRAGGEHHALGRRRIEQIIGAREQEQGDQHERPGDGDQVAYRQQRGAKQAWHAAEHSGN